MKLLVIIDILLGLLYIYIVFIHGYILGKKKFVCRRCGRCCRYKVHLSDEEIKNIKKAGYKEENFLVKKDQLKRVNGNCVFLTCKDGICSCKLQNSAKPSTCITFPYTKGLFGREYDYRCRSFWPSRKKSV